MRITKRDLETGNYVVFFEDRPLRTVMAADDEEGWVEIPDLRSLAPINLKKNDPVARHPMDKTGEVEFAEYGWEEIPVLRKQGKVEIRKIS